MLIAPRLEESNELPGKLRGNRKGGRKTLVRLSRGLSKDGWWVGFTGDCLDFQCRVGRRPPRNGADGQHGRMHGRTSERKNPTEPKSNPEGGSNERSSHTTARNASRSRTFRRAFRGIALAFIASGTAVAVAVDANDGEWGCVGFDCFPFSSPS